MFFLRALVLFPVPCSIFPCHFLDVIFCVSCTCLQALYCCNGVASNGPGCVRTRPKSFSHDVDLISFSWKIRSFSPKRKPHIDRLLFSFGLHASPPCSASYPTSRPPPAHHRRTVRTSDERERTLARTTEQRRSPMGKAVQDGPSDGTEPARGDSEKGLESAVAG